MHQSQYIEILLILGVILIIGLLLAIGLAWFYRSRQGKKYLRTSRARRYENTRIDLLSGTGENDGAGRPQRESRRRRPSHKHEMIDILKREPGEAEATEEDGATTNADRQAQRDISS
jgi:FtsZ-interacting cell division protein ZipA